MGENRLVNVTAPAIAAQARVSNAAPSQSHAVLRVMSELVPPVFLLALTGLLWLPFDLNIGYWGDGWPLHSHVDQGYTNLGSIMRPLEYMSFFFGHFLSPDSFVGMNVIYALYFFATGLLCYAILKQLMTSTVMAVAAGALAITVTVDLIRFYLGAASYHATLVAYLCALYLLIRFWKQPRLFLLAPIWLFQAVATLGNEAAYPLILFSPLVLPVVKHGSGRRLLAVSLLWYVVPLIVGLRFLMLLLQDDHASYQLSMLDRSITASDFVSSVAINYRQHFYDVWNRGLINASPRYEVYVLVAGIMSLIVLLGLWYSRRTEHVSISGRRLVAIAGGAFLAIGLGFASFLLTTFRVSGVRTFYFSEVALAIFIAAAIALLARHVPRISGIVFAVGITAVMSVGLQFTLVQHEDFSNRSEEQLAFFAKVFSVAPRMQPSTSLIVIDETEAQELRALTLQISGYLMEMARVLYSEPSLWAFLCYPTETEPWGIAGETCELTDEGVTVYYTQQVPSVPYFEADYREIVVIRYTADYLVEVVSDLEPYGVGPAAATEYDPASRIVFDQGLSKRAFTMLPPHLLEGLLLEANATTSG